MLDFEILGGPWGKGRKKFRAEPLDQVKTRKCQDDKIYKIDCQTDRALTLYPQPSLHFWRRKLGTARLGCPLQEDQG